MNMKSISSTAAEKTPFESKKTAKRNLAISRVVPMLLKALKLFCVTVFETSKY